MKQPSGKLIVDPAEIRSPCGSNVFLDLPRTSFQLGDRVMCISTDSDIPFGLRGTVVALILPEKQTETDTVDVLFDLKFIRGCNLGGRCSDLRGAEDVPVHFLLNLSAPPNSERAQMAIASREKKEREPREAREREPREPREQKDYSKERNSGKSRDKGDQVCRFWLQNGTCSYGNSCRFAHSQSSGSGSGGSSDPK